MPRTSFGIGTPANSEFLNKVARPKISNVDDDGNIPLLDNSAFAAVAGTVVFDFYNYADAFRTIIAPSGGLNIFVRSATFLMVDNTTQNFAAVTVAVPNNAISFVWRDINGALQITNTQPSFGTISAVVTSSSGVITSIVDRRFDFIIAPQTSSISIFGGTSQNDITLAAGVNTLTGIIECRNFTCPVGASIAITGSLTIRASGSVTISGNVTTGLNKISSNVGDQGVNLGGGNFRGTFGTTDSPDSGASPIKTRRKNSGYKGYFSCGAIVSTTTANTATFVNTNANILNGREATNGADFSIHCAGALIISPSVTIDLRSLPSPKPLAYLAGDFTVSTHPSSGLSSTDFTLNQIVFNSAGSAGVCVLQSATRVDIQPNVIINCSGENEGWSYSRTWNSPGGFAAVVQPLGNESFKTGAGGGGGIWIQAPVILSAVSATYNVNPGTMSTRSQTAPINLFVNGIGSVGRGYNSTTNVAAQPGVISSTIGYPVEF